MLGQLGADALARDVLDKQYLGYDSQLLGICVTNEGGYCQYTIYMSGLDANFHTDNTKKPAEIGEMKVYKFPKCRRVTTVLEFRQVPTTFQRCRHGNRCHGVGTRRY